MGRFSFRSWKACAGLLLAACAAGSQVELEPTDEEIMALFHPPTALAMGRLAALSYCGNELEPAKVEQCPTCERAGFEVVKGSVKKLFVKFWGNPQANFFILGRFQRISDEAKDVPSKGCFVVTRGSSNKANWVANVQQALVNPRWSQCPRCRVHKGFHDIYKRALPDIRRYLADNGCRRQGDPVWVTGHSMGGAVSSIMIAGLTGFGYNVALSYVLEPPMTGNKAYRQYFVDVVARSHPPVPVIRLTNGQDTAPSFPFKGRYEPLPYEFFSDPVWGTHRICRNSSKECAEGVDRTQTWASKSLFVDHVVLWYAPDHYMVTGFKFKEWCKLNPNHVLLQLELWTIGMYVFIVEAGPWNAVIRIGLLLLFLVLIVCLCVRRCRSRRKCLGDHYKRLP